MPSHNVLSAGAATAVWGIWTAIELRFRRHRAIPSRDGDKGSLLALSVAHVFRLVGMLVGFLDVGRIDGAGIPLQLSGLGLMVAGIAVRWTAIHALGVFFTGRIQIQEGHTLIRTGLYSRLRHPAYAGSLQRDSVRSGLVFRKTPLSWSSRPILLGLVAKG